MPCSSAQRPIASTSARRVHRAGRVARRHEEHRLRAGRAGRLELRRSLTRKPCCLGGGQHDRHPVGERDDLGVGRPVRRGEQHLVARVEQGLERVVHGLLAAVGDEHLAGLAVAAPSRGRSSPRSRPAARGARRSACSDGCGGRGRPRSRPRRCGRGSAKSGSPAPKPMTGSPAAFSALALASTARVADSVIAPSLRETRGMGPSSHGPGAGPVSFPGLRRGRPPRRSRTRRGWPDGGRWRTPRRWARRGRGAAGWSGCRSPRCRA